MKLDNLFTQEELKKAVFNMHQILFTEWIEITAASFSSAFPDKLVIRIKVENNDFYRIAGENKDFIELDITALTSYKKMEAFWTCVYAMHAETATEAIERRLKALEAKLENQ